tara:strand:- start:272 stop:520 length:249 start_codon:yes stop_codon:yes gene_type:complete
LKEYVENIKKEYSLTISDMSEKEQVDDEAPKNRENQLFSISLKNKFKNKFKKAVNKQLRKKRRKKSIKKKRRKINRTFKKLI